MLYCTCPRHLSEASPKPCNLCAKEHSRRIWHVRELIQLVTHRSCSAINARNWWNSNTVSTGRFPKPMPFVMQQAVVRRSHPFWGTFILGNPHMNLELANIWHGHLFITSSHIDSFSGLLRGLTLRPPQWNFVSTCFYTPRILWLYTIYIYISIHQPCIPWLTQLFTSSKPTPINRFHGGLTLYKSWGSS